MGGDGKDNVRVVVRCRPLFGKELAEQRQRIVEMDVPRGQVTLTNPKSPGEDARKFTFDRIFDWTCTQREVYEGAAKPIVDACIEGFNGTVFCYGQTGTGKTHTMEGKDEPASERGILPQAFHHVFDAIDGAPPGADYLVRASFLEIYNENIRDLLAKDQSKTCDLKGDDESGAYVKDLTTLVVKSASDLANVLRVGKKNRSVGATLMNADSSRSHSIFTITIETSKRRPGDKPGEAPHITVGKLNLVDLAGSERQSKTQATGERLKEATKINLSLSTLGNVISALVDGKSQHIPYRNSKLTRLLQDSLGGNTKTVMVANLGPADYNFDETMGTLRYANRAKNIKNTPKINEDPKDAMLREFQEEIARLKAQLGDGGDLGDASFGDASFGGDPSSPEVVTNVIDVDPDEDQLAALRRELEAETAERMRDATTAEDLERIKLAAEEQSREEMRKILEDKNATVEEKERLKRRVEEQTMELELRLDDAKRDRVKRLEMERKLKEMESKLVRGVDDLEARTAALELAEREGAAELEDREREGQRRRREIADLEQAALLKEESFASKKEEVADATKKLKKMFQKYQSAKADLEERARALANERDDMRDSVALLKKQLALKDAVLDAFVPRRSVKKCIARAHWEPDVEQWVLERVSDDSAPVYGPEVHPASSTRADPRARRPVSDAARIRAALGDRNPRYKPDNILDLDLDAPERTTWDLDGGADAFDGVQAVLDVAFSTDGGARLAPRPRGGSTGAKTKSGDRRRSDLGETVKPPPERGAEPPSRGAPGRPRLARPGSARRQGRSDA